MRIAPRGTLFSSWCENAVEAVAHSMCSSSPPTSHTIASCAPLLPESWTWKCSLSRPSSWAMVLDQVWEMKKVGRPVCCRGTTSNRQHLGGHQGGPRRTGSTGVGTMGTTSNRQHLVGDQGGAWWRLATRALM